MRPAGKVAVGEFSQRKWIGHLALVGQTLIICGGYVVGREAAQRFDPLLLTGLRAWASAAVYLAFIPLFRRLGWISYAWSHLPGLWKEGLWILAFLGIFFNQLLFNWGLRYTTAATTALIYALTPSVVFWLGVWVFRREKVSMKKITALFLAYVGVVLALWHNLIHATHGWGWLLILAAVGFWGWYLNFSPPIIERVGAIGVTAYVMILGAILHTPTLIIGLFRQEWDILGWGAWMSLSYLVLGMSVAAYLLLNAGLHYLTPTQTALYISFQPLGTTFLAASLGQEPLSWQLLVGALITTGGMLLFRR
ncbi:MAG: DMT family transporter [Bacteroidia bacterium]|nr:DMT family transporter [Bacteroidia bacterium]MDW8133536.1 DMT family transporter [Bacteroidia bacterium]